MRRAPSPASLGSAMSDTASPWCDGGRGLSELGSGGGRGSGGEVEIEEAGGLLLLEVEGGDRGGRRSRGGSVGEAGQEAEAGGDLGVLQRAEREGDGGRRYAVLGLEARRQRGGHHVVV